MKILHVTTGIDPKSGGPTRSVKGICRVLDKIGIDVTLQVLCGNHAFDNPGGVKVVYDNLPLPVTDFDIVHLQGLWSPLLHRVARACQKAKVPYVFSPRGMLDPWALSVKRWKKMVALWLYQRRDLKRAAVFHVTAEAEAGHVKALGFSQECIIVPNGVELPEEMPPKTNYAERNCRKAIFLSRLHPGKGLLTLADAWAKVRPKGWMMEVVGPDAYGHKAEVVKRLQGYGILDQWHFVDMLGDDEKWSAYRSADLLIHPSVSENFGITIAEGLASGLPVIATKGTPWKDIEDCKCGWWIDLGVDALVDALETVVSLDDATLTEMGQRGRKLVEEKYTWKAVCNAMIKGYEEVLNV